MPITPLTEVHPDDDPDAPLCGCGRRHWDHLDDDDDGGDNLTPPVRRCRRCGCTDTDCSGCIERTGQPCSWSTTTPLQCTACENSAVAHELDLRFHLAWDEWRADCSCGYVGSYFASKARALGEFDDHLKEP